MVLLVDRIREAAIMGFWLPVVIKALSDANLTRGGFAYVEPIQMDHLDGCFVFSGGCHFNFWQHIRHPAWVHPALNQ